MKENAAKEDISDSSDDNFSEYKQKYELILSNIIGENKFDINDKSYDDKMKATAIVTILEELLKNIKSKDTYIGKEADDKLNDFVFYIFNNLVKPIIKKETNDELFKKVFNVLCNNTLLKFIFTSRYNDYHKFLDKVTNKQNAELVMNILYDFIKIFFEKKKMLEINNFIVQFLEVIKESNYMKGYQNINDDDDNYEYTVIYAYKLFDKLILLSDEILEAFNQSNSISILCKKIMAENEETRKILYKSIKYIIKSSSEYTKELFDLEENEKEGRNIIIDEEKRLKIIIKEERLLKILINEDVELFILLIVLISKDDIKFLREFFFVEMTQLYEYLIEIQKIDKNEVIYTFLRILYSLSIVNDKYVRRRLQFILGYPNPIILQIPKEKNDPESQEQKWPIFGAKLINGNIDRHIYEFVNTNRRNKNMCLLSLLLPNENNNNDIEIPKEVVKNIIVKLIDNCLGEKNNYSLFKYLYLNPGRSLRYENLYQEMKQIVLNEDKEFNFEKYDEKEKQFIEHVKKEVEDTIKELKNKYTDDNDEYDDYDEDENPPPSTGNFDFKCEDKEMKKFIGFNCNIIPGDIVREEIVQIATGDYLALYRLEYYTKYYDTKELREKLLNPDIKKNENKNDTNDKDKINITEKGEETNNKKEEVESQVTNIEETKKEDNLEIKEENKELPKDKTEEEKEKETQSKEETKENEKDKTAEKKEEKTEEKEVEKEEEKNEEGDNKKENPEEETKKDSEEKKEEDLAKEQTEEEKNPEENPPKEEKESPVKEEDTKKEEKEEEKNESEKEENEIKQESSPEQEEEPEPEITTPIETDIDDSLEIKERNKNRIVKKFDISSITEDKIIYNILPSRESSLILEDKTIKDRNKVKRVLFRYIFTNNFRDPKKFRVTTTEKGTFTKIQKSNCCVFTKFIFDEVKEKDITNFYNVMRIRGELPFMERDNFILNIDITDSIYFKEN